MQQASVTAAEIEAVLRAAFAPSHLGVVDDSAAHAGHAGSSGAASGTHFEVSLTSDAFAGLGKIAQHRQVYAVLADQFARGLHALALKTSAD